jgi:hypothetical protein
MISDDAALNEVVERFSALLLTPKISPRTLWGTGSAVLVPVM